MHYMAMCHRQTITWASQYFDVQSLSHYWYFVIKLTLSSIYLYTWKLNNIRQFRDENISFNYNIKAIEFNLLIAEPMISGQYNSTYFMVWPFRYVVFLRIVLSVFVYGVIVTENGFLSCSPKLKLPQFNSATVSTNWLVASIRVAKKTSLFLDAQAKIERFPWGRVILQFDSNRFWQKPMLVYTWCYFISMTLDVLMCAFDSIYQVMKIENGDSLRARWAAQCTHFSPGSVENKITLQLDGLKVACNYCSSNDDRWPFKS